MSKIVRTIFTVFKVLIVMSSDLLDMISFFVTAVFFHRPHYHHKKCGNVERRDASYGIAEKCRIMSLNCVT